MRLACRLLILSIGWSCTGALRTGVNGVQAGRKAPYEQHKTENQMGPLNQIRGFDLIFPREYLRAALVVSLLSVWVLVGLFYYLNRYTKRYYFTVWTAAWLFYALWLTIGVMVPNASPESFVLILRQWCVSISAVFLLWGSLSFLELKTPQSLFGLFMA